MHFFRGSWITHEELAELAPRPIFHRQLDKVELPTDEHRNRHVLFRRKFQMWQTIPQSAHIYISADDYYKLYLNGKLVGQGPAPSYHFRQPYDCYDITSFLHPGSNTIAVHTLYQGLINRVWQSGDGRHGLLLDVELRGETRLWSNEDWSVAIHDGYTEMGTVGYDTQFLERYDSRAACCDFAEKEFCAASWKHARLLRHNDHQMREAQTPPVVLEEIRPVLQETRGDRLFLDFGAMYVGYLQLTASGKSGDTLTVRQGQELTEAGEVRYDLRANCRYEEEWILKDGLSRLDQFDYKSFRYAEVILPVGARIEDAYLTARHYPFPDAPRPMRPDYAEDETLRRIYELCVRTQKYGVQEVIQDCMEREKGFYVGDGCYTALTHLLLTGDDRMVRKLIDDAIASTFITEGMVTCLDCSFMQEIAEYPLILVSLILWHYRLCGDKSYLATCYTAVCRLLDNYRQCYEREGLLTELDKWCVVEWPSNFRDGYDVDVTEGQICHEPHVAINAYYIEAIENANRIAAALSLPPYRDTDPLRAAFRTAFYDPETHLFRDGVHTEHKSLIGNLFAFAFGLCEQKQSREAVLALLEERGLSSLSMFCTFPTLMGLIRAKESHRIPRLMKDEGAWCRILREGGTATFEGWGADTKWNTSLFHLTLSYGAVFLCDADLDGLFA